MPSTSSYLQDNHEVSALQYFSALSVTIFAALEDFAANFVSERRDEGIELKTVILERDGSMHARGAMVKKVAAKFEVPFWRRPPMLSRPIIEDEAGGGARRWRAEWKPEPPTPKQSKRQNKKKKREADLRSSTRGELVQQQKKQQQQQQQQQPQHQLEEQQLKEKQLKELQLNEQQLNEKQLKEQQLKKEQERGSTDATTTGGAAGDVKATKDEDHRRRMTAETCTPSTASLGAYRSSPSFFGSSYSTIVEGTKEKETPATVDGSPATSKKSSKWSALRAKVKTLQRSGALKTRAASARALGRSAGPELETANQGGNVFPAGLALHHRRAIEVETVRKFDRVNIKANSGDFWFIVDAAWMKAWVDFAMEKGDPPGPISNYNLYLDVSGLSLERQESVVKEYTGMTTGRAGALASRPDLKIRPGMKTGRDYRALHPLVWFVYREIYGTDGAPDLCRWEPDIYSAEVHAKSKVQVSWSCQSEALSVLLRSVAKIRQPKLSPFRPPKIRAAKSHEIPKVTKEKNNMVGTATGSVGRLLGRITHATQKKINKQIHGKRRKVLPRKESKTNNSSRSISSTVTLTTTTAPEPAF